MEGVGLIDALLNGGGLLAFAAVVWYELRALRAPLKKMTTAMIKTSERQDRIIDALAELANRQCPKCQHETRIAGISDIAGNS